MTARYFTLSTTIQLLAFVSVAMLLSPTSAASVHETVLYSFPQDGSTGNYPQGAMVADKAGNLYGTTLFGGLFNSNCSPAGCGTAFELSPPSEQGGAWTETVIYEFQGASDGVAPACTLVIDKDGNLYGTSSYGFVGPGAVVWELSPPAQPGDSWTFTQLYSMSGGYLGNDYFSTGNLVMDRTGNLYGTTTSGGTGCPPYGCGTVYEVSPPLQSGGNWTGAVIYNFQGGADGQNFATSLAIDRKGALYGGAWTGTSDIAFQLVPPSQSGGAWTKNVIFSFSEIAVFYGLVFDTKGNLYGASVDGPNDQGCRNRQGCGYVFELGPPLQAGGAWTETVLYKFKGGADGWYPLAPPILDGYGNLYGTTYEGGVNKGGTAYELVAPVSSGGGWTERRFPLGNNSSDYGPTGSLMFGPGKGVAGTGTGGFEGGGVFSISVQ